MHERNEEQAQHMTPEEQMWEEFERINCRPFPSDNEYRSGYEIGFENGWNACAALRKKCAEFEHNLAAINEMHEECAEQANAAESKCKELQRQLDEAAKQEPVAWAFEDGEYLYSVALFDNGGTPLYRLPPNLPAIIEQARAEEREACADVARAAKEHHDKHDIAAAIRARKP